MTEQVIDRERPDLGGNIRNGDICTHNPILWRYLLERFAVQSVLDVGCGEGHAVAFFRRQCCIAHGIDGLELNVRRAVTPIALHDLTRSALLMPVDMVWSCEVAEHLPDETIDYFIDTLANGRVVAMTHAIPGQPGHNHINCQPQEYWVNKMAAKGFTLDSQNEEYRRVAATDIIFNYFTTSGLIFHRQ
jgi:cyclopropane fatty-acyl-phospholipid synthase-like methyltransferase